MINVHRVSVGKRVLMIGSGNVGSVSYTHLDVYKRQVVFGVFVIHALIECIYEFDVRAIFCHNIQFIVIMLCSDVYER